MDMKRLGPVRAVAEGWSLLIRNPLELLGGFVLFAVIVAIFCIVPTPWFIRWPLLAIVVFPLLGGLLTLFVKAARDASPRLTDLFSGFLQFWKWFSVGWVYAGLFNVFLIPCLLILLAVANLVSSSLPASSDLRAMHCTQFRIAALMLAPVPAFLLFTQYAFMLFVTTEAKGVNRSSVRSQALLKGKPFRLRLTMVASMLMPYALLVIGCVVYMTDANAFGWLGWAVYAITAIVAMTVSLSALTWVFVCLDDSESPESTGHAAPSGSSA